MQRRLGDRRSQGRKGPKVATLQEYWDIYEAYWTYIYDLGHVQVTIHEAGERLYTEDEVKQMMKLWKREVDEKVHLALAANEYHLQAVTAFNGKFGYKGNPICFREAGRMDEKDRKCDGLVKGGGVC